MGWTLSLAEIDPDDVRSVGGKAAALARLVDRGLPVPPAFVLPVDAVRATLDHAGLT